LAALNYVDRFGVLGVYGRALNWFEIENMVTAENVVFWYEDRAGSKDWQTWTKQNPTAAKTLSEAMLMAIDKGWIDPQ